MKQGRSDKDDERASDAPLRDRPESDAGRDADELLPEYDFRPGVRGKYAARYAEGTNVVLLDPDVAAAFPDSAAVNSALRALLEIARRQVKGPAPAA
jgi:hypothetical protein